MDHMNHHNHHASMPEPTPIHDMQNSTNAMLTNGGQHVHHGMDETVDHSMMMMHMTFYFGVVNVPILFKEWTVNSSGEMAAACIGMCILAMLYEGLKVFREVMLRRAIAYRTVTSVCDDSDLIGRQLNSSTICAPSHILQTFLHLLQVTVSYVLMLVFMSFNAYLAISIIIGAGLGYFLFGWRKAVIVDINEHCH